VPARINAFSLVLSVFASGRYGRKLFVVSDLIASFGAIFDTANSAESRKMNGHPVVSRYPESQFARYQAAHGARSSHFDWVVP